jgi:hypothetical protein
LFSLVARLLSILNRFSATFVQDSPAIPNGSVVKNRLAIQNGFDCSESPIGEINRPA